MAFLVTRKRPSPENLAGLALATGGFAVLAWPRDLSGLNAGDLFVLVTAVSYAYVVVRLSESSGRHDVRWFATGQTACAAAVALLLRLAAQPFLDRPEALFRAEARPTAVDARFLGLLLWMALASRAFLLMTWAQARIGARRRHLRAGAGLRGPALFGERLPGGNSGSAPVLPESSRDSAPGSSPDVGPGGFRGRTSVVAIETAPAEARLEDPVQVVERGDRLVVHAVDPVAPLDALPVGRRAVNDGGHDSPVRADADGEADLAPEK
jgi:hypothetical protein